MSTKQKILQAGKKLFAEKGLNGTSTREIAHEAGVNLAGLHYHFQSKQHLYDEVAKSIFLEFEHQIETIKNEQQWDTESFSVRMLELLFTDDCRFIESLRILTAGSIDKYVPESLGNKMINYGNESYVIGDLIAHETSRDNKDEKVMWAVRVIMSFLKLNGLRYHLTRKTQLEIPRSVFEQDVRTLVRVIINELKKD
ncbi:MAG: TetR family transcriptional regulator [Elusimicrobia bacterium]|nr:TetR family transcriptional regulator [Elusimicrobiota bacterium]